MIGEPSILFVMNLKDLMNLSGDIWMKYNSHSIGKRTRIVDDEMKETNAVEPGLTDVIDESIGFLTRRVFVG